MSGGKIYAHTRHIDTCVEHMRNCPDCVEFVLAHIENAQGKRG